MFLAPTKYRTADWESPKEESAKPDSDSHSRIQELVHIFSIMGDLFIINTQGFLVRATRRMKSPFLTVDECRGWGVG